MPIFSLILMFILIYIFSIEDKKKKYLCLVLLTAVLNLLFLQGYFIKIGSKEIMTCGIVADRVLFFYSLYYLYTTRLLISKEIRKNFLLILFVPLVGIFLEVVFPFSGELLPYDAESGWDGYVYGEYGKVNYVRPLNQMLVEYIKMAIIWFNIMAMKIILDVNDIANLFHKMIAISYITILYGWLEFVIKNIISLPMLTYEFTAVFLGRNETSIWAEPAKKGGDWFVLQGFTKEPSHFVIVLFFISLGMIIYNKMIGKGIVTGKKYSIMMLIGNCILMYFTGGFSAVWCIFILWVCYALISFDVYRATGKDIIKTLSKSCVLFVALYIVFIYIIAPNNEYISGRMDNVFAVLDVIADNPQIIMLMGSGDASTIARLVSVFDTFQVALQRPLFGLGMGAQWAHDILATMLADFGIIGIIVWLRFVTTGDRKYDYILIGMIFFVWGLPFGIGVLTNSFYALFIEATSVYTIE